MQFYNVSLVPGKKTSISNRQNMTQQRDYVWYRVCWIPLADL